VLNEELTVRFDSDWYRNPSAGPWMVGELFSSGQRNTAEEIAANISTAQERSARSVDGGSQQRALSFSPLIRKVEALLA
jgi:hypothetical protein